MKQSTLEQSAHRLARRGLSADQIAHALSVYYPVNIRVEGARRLFCPETGKVIRLGVLS